MTTGRSTAEVVLFPKTARQRTHAARMFTWEDQVREDVWLNVHYPYALHVAVLLRKRMNYADETRRMELGWIAKQLGISRRTVLRAVNALIERNHLTKESGKSIGKASIYKAKVGAGVTPVSHPGCITDVTPGRTPASHKYFIFRFIYT